MEFLIIWTGLLIAPSLVRAFLPPRLRLATTVQKESPFARHPHLLASYIEECSLEGENPADCIEAQGFYQKDTSSYVSTVTKVFVAEVETLRGRFPSFEQEGDKGSNMMKYNKRNKGFNRRPETEDKKVGNNLASIAESPGFDTSTRQVNVEYTTLVVEDCELVLVDKV